MIENLQERALTLHARGFTVMPLYGVDLFEWKNYRNVTQTKQFLEDLDWKDALGVAVVAGSYRVNDVKVLKFHVEHENFEEVIAAVLKLLSLPLDYSWIVLSTSKRDFMLIVRGDYLQGTSFVTGVLEGSIVHIVMEGAVYIPEYFKIPQSIPLKVEKTIINNFLYGLKSIRGLQLDGKGYYQYYK